MKIEIANPIYDTVFKYLMEDDRIAKILLSALLKKRVVKAERRRHEYTDTNRDKISYFRIDFGATVQEEDGSKHLILIELQKTWLPSETVRFRHYLSQQYDNQENIRKDGKTGGSAIPMVAVYLLGHQVGDIEEPIIYMNRKAYDYEGKAIVKGLPDPFIDSIGHNSIIVQLPLLHGRVSNRLEEILSVFDQTNTSKGNMQTITIDDATYDADPDMRYIIKKLLMASSDEKVRREMTVEEEIFSEIDSRDVKLKEKEEMIEKQNKKINSQNEMLKSMAEALLKSGLSLEKIAEITRSDISELKIVLRRDDL